MSDDVVRQSATDEKLAASPVLKEVLGDALPVLKMFHVKLLEEGVTRGVIGPRDTNILWERHILNSAAIVPWIREFIKLPKSNRVADVGSGGGFPGLVAAACMPEAMFTLIEPMERRVDWLNECVGTMGLKNVQVVRARAEQVSASIRSRQLNPFNVVTCRAVAPMKKLAGWTLPLLAPGGRLVALKGRSAAEEMDKAAKQISEHHGVNAIVTTALVGPGLEPTHVIIVEKRKRSTPHN